MTDWTSTSTPSTNWQAVVPGTAVSASLLTLIQSEAAAAQGSATAAAASAAGADAARDLATAAALSASQSADTATQSAIDAASAAAQAQLIADTLEGGGDGTVPTLIESNETFTVPEDRQALFVLPIIVEGVMVVDGALIEVD